MKVKRTAEVLKKGRYVRVLVFFALLFTVVILLVFQGKAATSIRASLADSATHSVDDFVGHPYNGERSALRKYSVLKSPGKSLETRDLSMEERLRLLELKTNAHLGWITDPRIGARRVAKCRNPRNIAEHHVCLDNIEKDNCVVYDVGIRAQPLFGVVMANEYGCEVHAFDPSPIAMKFFKKGGAFEKDIGKKDGLKEGLYGTKYFYHPYGGGGVDGDISSLSTTGAKSAQYFLNATLLRSVIKKQENTIGIA